MPDIRLLTLTGDTVSYDARRQLVPMCEGPAMLVQIVLNHLITTPGSDMFTPTRGGGLLQILRRMRIGSPGCEQAIGASVRKVEFDILEDQKGLPLKDDERLASLQFLSVTPIKGHPDRALIALQMKIGTGQSFSFQL